MPPNKLAFAMEREGRGGNGGPNSLATTTTVHIQYTLCTVPQLRAVIMVFFFVYFYMAVWKVCREHSSNEMGGRGKAILWMRENRHLISLEFG